MLRRDAVLAVFLAALATWMTWPLGWHLGTHVYDPAGISRVVHDYVHPDISLNLWILAWIARTLPTAPSRLFAGPIYYPADDSIAYSDHMLGVAPISLAAYWGTNGNPVFTHQAVLFGSFVLCAIAMGLVIRILTRSYVAAVVGGALYAFAPWRLREIFGVQRECTFYLPLALLFAVLYLDGGRWRHLGLMSLCLSAQALAAYALGYPAFAALVPFVLAYALVAGTAWGRSAAALGGVVAAALLTAALSMPYLRATHGRVVPAVESWAPDILQRRQVANLASYLNPQGGLWPGGLSLALAAAGCAVPLTAAIPPTVRTSLPALVLGSLAMVVSLFVLSLGPHAEVFGLRPLAHLWQVVPGLGVYRSPWRFSFGLTLPLAVLGSLAVAAADRLARRAGGRRGMIAAWSVGIALVAGVCWQAPAAPIAVRPVPPEGTVPGVYAWLAGQRCDAAECPLLEVPAGNAYDLDPRYVTWTLVHGHPAVNGYSGYAPAAYPLIVSLANQLPGVEAARALARLAAMRWIVVHRAKLTDDERRDWGASGLAPVATFDGDVVYAVPAAAESWRALYLDPPADATFAGTPLAPLPPAARAGLGLGAPARVAGRAPLRVSVSVRNDGPVRWPSLTSRTENRVAVVVAWTRNGLAAIGVPAETIVLPADLDPGQELRLGARVLAPPAAGPYALEARVVQGGRTLARAEQAVDVGALEVGAR